MIGIGRLDLRLSNDQSRTERTGDDADEFDAIAEHHIRKPRAFEILALSESGNALSSFAQHERRSGHLDAPARKLRIDISVVLVPAVSEL